MLPSEYLFSFFTRQISNLYQLFSCKCNEGNAKTIKVSKKILERSSGAGVHDDFLCEISEMVSASYREMRAWAAAVDGLLDHVSDECRPPAPCGEQRRALEHCLHTHTQQPLDCYHLVTEFMQCARDCALDLDDQDDEE